jgi:hypothetical protein
MTRGDPPAPSATPPLPDRRLEDGNLYCAECGRQIPEARDRLCSSPSPGASVTSIAAWTT